VIFFGPGPVPFLVVILLILGSLVFFGPVAPGVLVLFVPLVLLAAVFKALTSRRAAGPVTTGGWDSAAELEEPADFDEVRRAAQDDLLALADDIRALDLDIEMPGADEEAKRDYARALDLYDRAKQAFDRAQRPDDLEAVSEAVADGRFAMASARARLEGREPPERRPPCFFDPRHGPSVRDVEWAPPGGTPRPVPACAADAIRIEEGQEPFARQVVVDGERRPYWDAPPAFGPWAGGFFGGAGAALLPALFFGSLLGSGFGSGGPGFFGDDDRHDFGGFGGGFGDFGSDDFGGGDDGGFGSGGDGDFGGGGGGGGDVAA
jgi:hypothetical protein